MTESKRPSEHHETELWRLEGGLWRAACSCGWFGPKGGKVASEQWERVHARRVEKEQK